MKKLVAQLFKFGIVGVIAMLIDVGVLTFLKEIVGMGVLVSAAIGFSVSVTANYVLSMLFVFKGKGGSKVKEFIVFVTLSVIGLGINQLIMWLGTDYTAFHYLLVKVFATFLVMIYNFVSRKIFLEKKPSMQ